MTDAVQQQILYSWVNLTGIAIQWQSVGLEVGIWVAVLGFCWIAASFYPLKIKASSETHISSKATVLTLNVWRKEETV